MEFYVKAILINKKYEYISKIFISILHIIRLCLLLFKVLVLAIGLSCLYSSLNRIGSTDSTLFNEDGLYMVVKIINLHYLFFIKHKKYS